MLSEAKHLRVPSAERQLAETFGRYQNDTGSFAVEFCDEGTARVTLWGARRLDATWQIVSGRVVLLLPNDSIVLRRTADGSLIARRDALPGVLRRCA